MAYDRHDTRRGRYPDPRERGQHEDRGFFERAGDEIASWFGDDDAERRRRHDERSSRASDRDRDRNGNRASGSNRDYDRGYGRDYDRERNRTRDDDRGFFPEHGYLSSDYDPDYEDRSGARPMKWTSSDRSYREGSRGGYGRGGSGGDNWGTGWGYGASAGPSYRFADRNQDRQRDFDRGSDRQDDYRQTSYAGSGREHDGHYQAWRQRHLDELDRDYDDYHRENQARFENDFGSWRERRQQKRSLLSQVREHSDVVGSDGEHVGTVDRVTGDRIILTKSDSADNRHHSIPCTMVDRIEGDKVVLDTKAEEAKTRWRDESTDRALFEREDQGEAGPRNLDRSFSGTYENR